MKRIVIFTASYPYDKAREATFIEPELEELEKNHDVTIVPLRKGGEIRRTREGLKIETGFCEMASRKFQSVLRIMTKRIFWRLFLKEMTANPRVIGSRSCLKKLFIHLYYCLNLKCWLSKQENGAFKNGAGQEEAVYYSYWFDSAVTALCLLRESGFEGKVITRAHGFDLYEFRHARNYIPCRKMALEGLDKVVFISGNGLKYMKETYPEFTGKYCFFPMGIKDTVELSKPSTGSKFRIVSCSMMVPVKRVDMIARAVAMLGKADPNCEWEWTHIGDGPEREKIEQVCRENREGKVRISLKGDMSNDEVLEFYKKEQIDLYIILSSSEGRPVALMEALGHGLPVVATDVGGVGEMVRDGVNGVLLPADLSVEEAARAITALKNSPEKLAGMRKESRTAFRECADAEVNFGRFSAFLESL
ncbi:MAG TPA: glycosyltransferase [Acidobacteriota bacterium]|nr:glycosyltransferase [Acidobacteriota bacterium]HNT17624.1 glycosyltransferase [Acidobacteriota bacterium]